MFACSPLGGACRRTLLGGDGIRRNAEGQTCYAAKIIAHLTQPELVS